MPKLPRRGTWIAGLVDLARGGEQALVVYVDDEADARLTRVLESNADLSALLGEAARAPASGTPARPRTVVMKPAMEPLLGEAVRRMGAKVSLQAEIPSLDALQRRAREAPSSPSLATDAAWQPLNEQILAAMPWPAAARDVAFLLHGARELHGRAAAVGPFGLRLHDRLPDLLVHDVPQFSGLWGDTHLVVEPTDEGLRLSEQAPHRPPVAMASDDEAGARAAVQAVLAAVAEHGVTLGATETRTVVQTEVGPVVVQALPPATVPAESLAGEGHHLTLLDGALMVIAREDHAPALADALQGVTALRLTPHLLGATVTALAGDRMLGVLSHAGLRWPRTGTHPLRVLTQHLDESSTSVVFEAEVTIDGTLPEPAEVPETYRGPTGEWPGPGAVLGHFLEPLQLMEMDPRWETVVRWAAMVWGAGVMADHHGQSDALAALLRAGPAGLVRMLHEHRRAAFPYDRRFLDVRSVTRDGDGLQLMVDAHTLGSD